MLTLGPAEISDSETPLLDRFERERRETIAAVLAELKPFEQEAALES